MKKVKLIFPVLCALVFTFCLTGLANAARPGANLITAKGAGPFILGKKLPASMPGYEIREETRQGEEGEEEKIITVFDKGAKALEISPDYSDIVIFSHAYRTEKGAKVGATLEELLKAYPEYSLWYTYVSQRFIFEAAGSPTIQILLDGDNFIGKQDLTAGDMVELSPTDFKPGTKVTAIRVYH